MTRRVPWSANLLLGNPELSRPQARRRLCRRLLDLGRGVNGRRVRRKVTGATARDARERLRQLREDVEAGASALDGNVTVGVFLADWLEREVPRFARSVNTLENYRWAVEGHLIPGRGHIRLARLTADDVDALLEDRATSGRLARSSVGRLTASLMSAAGVPLEHVADVLGHNGMRMAALVYRHVLAPTVEAGAGPMQALLGEPDEAIGSLIGSPEPRDAGSECEDSG